MDRANNRGLISPFNLPAQDPNTARHGQHATLHPNAFGNGPAQDLSMSAFGLNNGIQTQFNIPVQGPSSSPYLSNQDGSPLFNMPTLGSNAVTHGQNQGSLNRSTMPGQDLTALLHGQYQEANIAFNTCFPHHIASPDNIHVPFGHHPDSQEDQNFHGRRNNQGVTGHIDASIQDQQLHFHGQIHGVQGQNPLTQQPSAGEYDRHQGIAHSSSRLPNEPNTRSHGDNQDGRRPTHASLEQSPIPRYIPGVPNPTSGAEASVLPRGRLSLTLNGLQTPLLARPRPGNIQHSPPRRAFHSPITPDIPADFATTRSFGIPTTTATTFMPSPTPATPSIPLPMSRTATNDNNNNTNNTERQRLSHSAAREALIRQRLVMAEYLKKLNLQYLRASRAEQTALERDLATGWAQPGANNNLPALYACELRLMEANRLWDKFARGFRGCEEEIEELWGDLMVPTEARLLLGLGEGDFLVRDLGGEGGGGGRGGS